MTIDIHWQDPEQRILHYRFADTWNWSELQNIHRQAQELLKARDEKVSLILDFSPDDVLRYRSQLSVLAALLHVSPYHENIILVGAMPYVSYIEQIMNRTYPENNRKYKSAENIAAAYRLIQSENTVTV